MKKVKKLIKKIIKAMKENVKRTIIIVGIVVVAIIIISLYNRNERIDNNYLITILERSSELTTAKLHYTGMSEFEDEGIDIINKSSFKMVYEATARVGIDVKEVKVDVDNLGKVVWLTIPKAEILDVKVDMNSIKYFDEKFSLFNFNSKEDANKANGMVEDKAKEELQDMGILEMADNQAEALVKGLIQDVVPEGYEIKVKQ